MTQSAPGKPIIRALATAVLTLPLLGGCGTAAPEPERVVQIQRTTHGVAHIEAPDYEVLAYGVAYAHAEDNVCQTANHLVTVRGERSRFFGGEARSLLGLRALPNEQIDIFVRAHMDDAGLAQAQRTVSDNARAIASGYVDGYNRFLDDHKGTLPAACDGKAWVRPMTGADYLRMQELTMVQIGVALMADAIIAAAPPATDAHSDSFPDRQQAVAALRRFRLNEPFLGSNGWAFGSEVTTNGSGMLLGNPHFPWAGVNRFWQMHLTVPGELDVMGAAIGNNAVVQIGFNKDVAWTHTVSTGKRFTLHELELVPGEPTSYLIDGQKQRMTPKTVSFEVRNSDGSTVTRTHTIWRTKFGPIVVVPRAGLGWDGVHAYALHDANSLNLRAIDIWLRFNKAHSVGDLRHSLGRLGVPWVNTVAADRHGDVLYADVSSVPDVDADTLRRCAPSESVAGLFEAAGLVILDGSSSDCGWRQDPDSPVPGLTPIERMPVAVRQDWVQNSNDSFWLSNPDIDWHEMSPLIGATETEQSLRTRAGLYEIRERLSGNDGMAARGTIGIDDIQKMLFRNHNHAAYLVIDDLLDLCEQADTPAAREGCATLASWDRRDNLESRGAHLFREWWRQAGRIDDVWRRPFDRANAEVTPGGLRTDDAGIRTKLLALLEQAVETVRSAGFAIDAALGDVQFRTTRDGITGLHGGDEFEGVLNKVETRDSEALGPDGYRIVFGTSYVQTVTFDDRGPVAQGILTYGQSTQPDSPFAFDQLPLFANKQWPTLPFHPEDIEATRVGPVTRLTLE